MSSVAREPRRGRGRVFLVRVWIEDGKFRARITCTNDVASQTAPMEEVTADPKDVHRLLAAWIDEAGADPSAAT